VTTSTTPQKTVLSLLAACGLLTSCVATLLWVDSRRVEHYNDEINDLRRHVVDADGRVQLLNQKLKDCLYLKRSSDSVLVPRLRGWE
jgi:hypothetical protein